MGVMACSRKDCDSIMCDTYIQSVGYVCLDCQSEFKTYLQKNSLDPTTEGQIKKELEKFMTTSKDLYVDGEVITVDDFFTKQTR
jgi:hypothetical protein